jgi:hypothetical protein
MLARDMRDLRQFRSARGRYSNYGDGDYRYNQNRRYELALAFYNPPSCGGQDRH